MALIGPAEPCLLAVCKFVDPSFLPTVPSPLEPQAPPPSDTSDVSMAADTLSEHAPTLTPHPIKKGKMKAQAAPSVPPPVPPPPKAQPPAPPPKKATQPASPPPFTPATYAKAMASTLKPKPATRPSLMVTPCHTSLSMTLRELANTWAPSLVAACNEALTSKAYHASVWVSAAKWAPSGNLVIFMGPDMNLIQLQSAHHIIVSALEATLPQPTPRLTP